jgi:hypothetical protein
MLSQLNLTRLPLCQKSHCRLPVIEYDTDLSSISSCILSHSRSTLWLYHNSLAHLSKLVRLHFPTSFKDSDKMPKPKASLHENILGARGQPDANGEQD